MVIIRCVIDTDTAGDDVFALLLALRSPGVQVEGITVCAGNVGFDHQVENALRAVEWAGKSGQIPVYAGCRQPLLRRWRSAAYVHGENGLGDRDFPLAAQRAERQHAVDFLLSAAEQYAGELVVIAQAPLTNLAVAVTRKPELAQQVHKLWVMGGSNNSLGNIAPLSEYNFYVDPEAARIVFQAGFNLYMVGWDIALAHSLLGDQELTTVQAMDGALTTLFWQTQQRVLDFNRSRGGIAGTSHPDSLTVAMAIDETLWLDGMDAYVDIETQGELTRGTSLVDRLGVWGRPANAHVCLQADGERFRKALLSLLATGDAQLSPRQVLPATL